MLNIEKDMSPKEKIKREAELQGLSSELKEITLGKEDIFYKYCEKSLIGKEIINAFLNYNELHKKGEFIFSEDIEEVGILSELQGFQTICSLIEQFELEPGKEAYKIGAMLDKVFALLNISKNTDNIVFNFSPFLKEAEEFNNGSKSYIDTITWAVSAMLSVFRLHIAGTYNFTEKQIESACEVLRRGIKYINNAFIKGDLDNNVFDCGWNYTEKCTKPSLYFVFAVSEMLIDIYTTFTSSIIHYEITYVQNEIDRRFAELIAAETNPEIIKELELERDLKKQKIVDENEKHIVRFQSKDPSAVRERELFEKINTVKVEDEEISAYDENAPYQTLEKYVKMAANDIWCLVKDNISSSFFSYDLRPIDDELIEQSASSDALFNSIFIINIVVNAGLDEDLDDEINYYTHSDSASYNDALEKYDDLRETLKIAFDHTNQVYNDLVKKNKEYKVNEFSITLDEDFPRALIEEVKEIRKAHIRVFSLMPLLIKTKTLMSDFVIRYPQYDMQIFLERILKYRLKVNNEYVWLWEENGYSSSSNYYFVTALGSFFGYYEEFENDFLKNSRNNNNRREKIEKDYLTELKKDDNIIGQLEKEKEKLIAERDAVKKKLEESKARVEKLESDPLRDALRNFITETVEDNFFKIMNDMLGKSQTLLENSVFNPDEEESYDESTEFAMQVKKFILALISNQLLEMMKASDSNIANYKKMQKDISKDFNEVVKIYIFQVLKSGLSAYTRNDGFIDFSDILNIIKDKKGKD